MNYFEDILKIQRPIEQDGAWKSGLKHFFYFAFCFLSGMIIAAIFVAIASFIQLDVGFGGLKQEIGISLFFVPIAFSITAYLIIRSRQKHDKLGWETLIADGKLQFKFFLFGLIIYVISVSIINCFSVIVHNEVPKNFAQFITLYNDGLNEEFGKLSRFSPLGKNAYIYYLFALFFCFFIKEIPKQIFFPPGFPKKFRQFEWPFPPGLIISPLTFGF